VKEFMEKIGKVKKIASIDESTAIIENNKALVPSSNAPPDKALFDSLMHKGGRTLAQDASKKAKHDSLIDDIRKNNNKLDTTVSVGEKMQLIRDNSRTSLSRLRTLRTSLIDPKARLKTSFLPPLRNKFALIQDHLNVLADTSGSKNMKNLGEIKEVQEGDPVANLPKPIRRFISLLTEGQNKLEQLDGYLSTLTSEELSPAKMLAIQIKMGHISHEIELFSSLLNKALESTKTIMNVQV
jgi:hypothetical protein